MLSLAITRVSIASYFITISAHYLTIATVKLKGNVMSAYELWLSNKFSVMLCRVNLPLTITTALYTCATMHHMADINNLYWWPI